MNRFVFLILLGCGGGSLLAQSISRETPRAEFGAIIMRYELSSESLPDPANLKAVAGIYFNRFLPQENFYRTISFSFSSTNIESGIEDWGHKGKLTEVMASCGIGFMISGKRQSPVKPFVQLEGYADYTNYQGVSWGGLTPIREFESDRFTMGMLPKVGLHFTTWRGMTAQTTFGFQLGRGRSITNGRITQRPIINTAATPFELRIGVLL